MSERMEIDENISEVLLEPSLKIYEGRSHPFWSKKEDWGQSFPFKDKIRYEYFSEKRKESMQTDQAKICDQPISFVDLSIYPIIETSLVT